MTYQSFKRTLLLFLEDAYLREIKRIEEIIDECEQQGLTVEEAMKTLEKQIIFSGNMLC